MKLAYINQSIRVSRELAWHVDPRRVFSGRICFDSRAGDSDDDSTDAGIAEEEDTRIEPESGGGSPDSEAVEEVVEIGSGSCDSLDNVPHPLQGDLVVS